MQTTKHPYELLIRWDQNGNLSGAHVQHRFVIRDGENFVGETIGQAEPLQLSGFPLSDLLSKAQSDALAQFVDMKERATKAETERDQALALLQKLNDLT